MEQRVSDEVLLQLAVNAIEKIEALKLDEVSSEEVSELVALAYGNCRSDVLFVVPGTIMYRGIKYQNRPMKFEEIIYPPKQLATRNRANDNGEQLFYCCTQKKAPFYELHAKSGDRLLISTWQCTALPLVHLIGFNSTEIENLVNSYRYSGSMISITRKEREMDTIAANFSKRFFCKKIDKENESYKKLTIAIAKQHYNIQLNANQNKKMEIDGILYPTIQLDMLAENFAFKPYVVDNGFLEFTKAEYIEVIKSEENCFEYRVLDFADRIIDNQIVWLNRDKTWTIRNETDDIVFIANGNQFDFYTIDGDQIYPD